jgi:glycosyltransferase 2 family protein
MTAMDRVEPRTNASHPRRAAVSHRMAMWRFTTFGPASEEPYRRRVPDGVRLVLAAAVLAALAGHAAASPTTTEVALFQFFNSLPEGLHTLFRSLYAVGTLWAVALAMAAALIGRRWRLARDLLVAGVAAWGIARVLGAWVLGSSLTAGIRAVTRVSGETPSFPFARLAVVVAVIATAGPYLTRPTRRVGQALVIVLALSALYLGTALPNDILGGLVLGWGVAAAVHVGFGSPGGRPTAAQVTAALAELGVDATGMRLAPTQPHGGALMLGQDERGPLAVRVIGRDEADTQFLAKLWRFLAYKDSGPTLYLTRLQEVEHDAYLTLVARGHGVRTPEVVVAGQAGPKTAVLVERQVHGRFLADMDASTITDELLVEIWRHVGVLHRAHVTHGALDAMHVVVGDEGPVIVGFSARSTLSPPHTEHDVLALLVSSAAIVGAERAVTAAVRGLGAERAETVAPHEADDSDEAPDSNALARVLPLLQLAALTREVRSAVAHRVGRKTLKATLDELRAAGARAAGVPQPELQELHRVSGTNLLLAVGTCLGVFALLSQVGSPSTLWRTVHHADWTWLVVALALSMATNVLFALALMGTIPRRLPLWPTTELQVSMSFTNLAVPAVGGTASQIRFLQKHGTDLPTAVAAGGLLTNLANVVVSAGLLAVALVLSPHSFRLGAIPVGGVLRIVLGLVVAAAGAAAVTLGFPRVRRAVLPPVRQATSTLAAVFRSPRQLAFLSAGFGGAAVVYAFCLLACLKAFGTGLSVWTLLALWIAVQTIASIVPVPGGGTALSSVGMSGVMTGFGLPTEAAVAAVLVNQLVVNYLPAVPGWFATEHLIRNDDL